MFLKRLADKLKSVVKKSSHDAAQAAKKAAEATEHGVKKV